MLPSAMETRYEDIATVSMVELEVVFGGNPFEALKAGNEHLFV